MKGGKKKSAGRTLDAEQPPFLETGENAETEFVGDDVVPPPRGEEGEGDGVEREEEGEEIRPVLPKGFYEMEAVRDKRVRKGKIQYLVKWRGYPETANTWEPKKNLKACFDIVKAFEESSKLGKHSTGKRGKRKSEVIQTQPKQKKRHSAPATATYNVPVVRDRIIVSPLSMAPLDDSNSPAGQVEGSKGQTNGVDVSSQAIGCGAVPTQNKDVKIGEPKGTLAEVNKFGSASFPEEPPKVNDVEQGQSGRYIGSRRRKSGSVKRFAITSVPREPIGEQNGTSFSVNDGFGGFESQESKVTSILGCGLNHEKEFGFPKGIPTITGILKVISYDARDASIIFRAMRSDGTEVIVDNKFLKANNPLLLINFYEKHLSYYPTPLQ